MVSYSEEYTATYESSESYIMESVESEEFASFIEETYSEESATEEMTEEEMTEEEILAALGQKK